MEMVLAVLAYSGNLDNRMVISGNIDVAVVGASALARDSGTWCSRVISNIPYDATIERALLFWTSGFWGGSPGAITHTTLKSTNINPTDIPAQAWFTQDYNRVMFADITHLISGPLNGSYSCQKMDRARGFSWCLLLVYSCPDLPKRELVLRYGNLDLAYNGDTVSWYDTLAFSATSSPSWAKLVLFSVGGDDFSTGDMVVLNGHKLSNAMNPWDNTGNGSFYDPFNGQSGWMRYPDGPADIDVFETGPIVGPNKTRCDVRLVPAGDWSYYAFVGLLVDVQGSSGNQEVEPIFGLKPVAGGRILRLNCGSSAQLRVYSVQGSLVLRLELEPGQHTIRPGLAPGVYVFSMGSAHGVFTVMR